MRKDRRWPRFGVLAFVTALLSVTVASAGPLTVHPAPVFKGASRILAGDPSIVVTANGFDMYYSCYVPDLGGVDVCLAQSVDGKSWSMPKGSVSGPRGRVLKAEPGSWRGAHETPFAVRDSAATRLYAVAYRDARTGFLNNPTVLGLATSVDGKRFDPVAAPVLQPAPGASDDHGLTSPSIVRWRDRWVLIYTGWCLKPDTCPRMANGLLTDLLAATSEDGVNWTRVVGTRFADTRLPSWAPGGMAETHVFEAAPGQWVLLFTALTPDKPMAVGLATSSSPLGPWIVRSQPILTVADIHKWADKGPVAPHGMVQDGRLRLWFAGETSKGPTYSIGYAEGPWPLP